MFLFILAIAILLVGIGAAVVAPQPIKTLAPIIGTVVAAILIFISCVYTQSVGEAKVIRNADGTIAKQDVEAGFGMKAPWQDAVTFDITGQQAIYKLNGEPSSEDEEVHGPEITITVENVPVNIDVAVRYSIDPNKVADLYTTYKSQEGLFARVISQDIKATVREAANGYTVDSLQSNRAEYSAKLEDLLSERWASQGIIVDSVALQGIRPPQEVTDRFNETQAAQTELIKAQAQTKVIEEQAKQKIAEANGQAEANRILNESLTDRVLQQKYIDALANADGLVVTPDGSTPMVQVPNKE